MGSKKIDLDRAKKDGDKHGARELVLWVENTQKLYKKHALIEQNMLRKVKRGSYNFDLSVKGFLYVVEDGARDYRRECGGALFDVPTRILAAYEFAEEFRKEHKLSKG